MFLFSFQFSVLSRFLCYKYWVIVNLCEGFVFERIHEYLLGPRKFWDNMKKGERHIQAETFLCKIFQKIKTTSSYLVSPTPKLSSHQNLQKFDNTPATFARKCATSLLCSINEHREHLSTIAIGVSYDDPMKSTIKSRK